ncbi:unnamed protein product [Nippostrongylus brasiliensis]|uniref:Secreted protein n=1 Tax=Nippostrongylus brasiliensis TaxID=27835 RepID=A0A0N4XRN8_NIPBR|nr:unnamed protein product [Nippostrongylus brasiliensis]
MRVFLLFILIALKLLYEVDGRGGRRGGKGKGKSNLQFAQVAEFSLIHTQLADNRVRSLRQFVTSRRNNSTT